jgi:hypothetical protein
LAKLTEQRTGHMPQPTSDPVTFDSGPHLLANHQSDARRAGFVTVGLPAKVQDHIGLRHTDPVLHRRVKVN